MSYRTPKPLPTTFIPKEVVNERVNNYLANKHNLLSAAISKDDSISAWYSLEQFEELMREMYYQNADGLRIYFGALGEEDLLYPNQLTIIFVPTYLDENTSKHTDIIIDNEAGYVDREEAGAKKLAKSAGSNTKKNLDALGLCPPSCSDHDCAYPLPI